MITKREFLATMAKASCMAAFTGGAISITESYAQEGEAASTSAESATQGKSRLSHRFGLGGVAIGNGMNVHSDEDCRNTLEAAWNAGVRLYDTSPWYGVGLSERRFGNFLYNKKREDYILTTKVGRVLHPDKDFKLPEDALWKSKPNFNYTYDFSGPGVRRSIEDSLQRMGLPYIDYIFIHDLDSDNEDIKWEERFEECKKGAFPELSKMRDEGIIKGWGLGVNQVDPILRTIKESDPDIFLCAAQYSLIKHDDVIKRLFPVLDQSNIQLVLGGVLNGGYLAGTPRYSYKESLVTPEISQKRDKLRSIADKHNVDLRTAAIQFGLSPSQVTAIVIGAHTPQQSDENIKSLSASIPEDFWAEVKEEKLVLPDASTSYKKVSLS